MSKVSNNYLSPRTKATGVRQNEAAWKERVRELESEVSSLKKRLDELRKAKSTTVLKKEKEYVTFKQHRRPPGDSSPVVDKKLSELIQIHNNELKKLEDAHKADMKRLREEHSSAIKFSQETSVCHHEQELKELRSNIKSLEDEKAGLQTQNENLQVENIDLRAKFEELFTELSLKEAQWCEKEEQLNLKLKLHWGEKYREWMEATEKKIAELQKANELLRSYVRPPPDD
ncbi:uncharacterized protein [Apostichopus japonicus]|uniref:uncharacterized protein n=1 Tax=Stichopus japonicus TaxID=307972 RepID=UPI003AB4EA58